MLYCIISRQLGEILEDSTAPGLVLQNIFSGNRRQFLNFQARRKLRRFRGQGKQEQSEFLSQ